MAREEALAYALRKKAGLESEINRSNCGYGNWVMYSAELDFTNACISALKGPTREQVEKMRGEWIPFGGKYIRRKKCSRCGWDGQEHIKFYSWCPACGAPMTDEAVEMMMKRLEEMRNDQ